MTPRLRIQSVIVTPVLVWDDGEELTPGPELGQISLTLSNLPMFAEGLPAEVAALAARLAEGASPVPGQAD
ncbi:hypothetical protein C3B59_10525 [Cryobacterium zongtaii]|uniref:Uncharacterized protein n=1 Tax=Cryobacterium zongtaii TaxID=1259217 RepID=A0A2S3ZCH8_9MICO|nr:hypothetical protein [Cryobacterium zongtaii]POH63969.1 hypothetical protein C3B59_10525 [Cryobacterium zongtaii]